MCQLSNFTHSDRSNLRTCRVNLCNYCVNVNMLKYTIKFGNPLLLIVLIFFKSIYTFFLQFNKCREGHVFVAIFLPKRLQYENFFDKGVPASKKIVDFIIQL